MKANDGTTRRRFLEGSAAGAGHVASSLLSASSFAAVVGANDRVQIGVIGTGGRALQLMDHLIPKPRDPVQGGIPQWKTKPVDGADLVAVADVYEPHRNQAAAKAGPKTAKFHDYRKLLDQKEVQAVIIAAPDHWHKQMLLDALAAGKDVYLEKPATHTLEEGPEEIQAVEKSGRIVQTGTQQRSWPHYVQGKEIVASGALGVVRLVEAFWFMNYGVRGVNNLPRSQVPPANLDWKSWLGSAPDQPFNPMKFRTWRQFWDFGGGNLADLMTHAIDAGSRPWAGRQGARVAALDFASARDPGGGFLAGARAQEDSLARASGLYALLLDDPMSDHHRSRKDPFYTAWVIDRPDVPVFRLDERQLIGQERRCEIAAGAVWRTTNPLLYSTSESRP